MQSNDNTFDDIAREVDAFKEYFSQFRNKRIAIYGTGRLTQRLLPAIRNEYDIVALMDGNPELMDGTKYGLDVVSIGEVEGRADIVIINTAEIYWGIIGDRLKACKLPVYFANGERMSYEDVKVFDSIEDYGGYLYGPVVHAYFCWLLSMTASHDINQLLFLARDGFLLIDEYNYFTKVYEINEAPEAKYIAASRRMVLVAGIHDEESFMEVASHTFSGTFKGYMWSRFLVDVSGDVHCNEKIVLPRETGKLKDWIKPYRKMMLDEAEQERKAYLNYLSNMRIRGSAGIVDTGYSGRIPYHLSDLLGNKGIKTFYWYGNLDSENKYNRNGCLYACFQDEADKKGKNCCLQKYRILNESTFSAPYGMMRRFVGNEIEHMEEDVDFTFSKSMDVGIKRYITERAHKEGKELPWDLDAAKRNALAVDAVFGERVRKTRLSTELQEKIHYKDGWFGDI